MSIKHMTFAFLMASFATSIQAETVNCTPITSLPAVITQQGLFCLTGNLSTSQSSGVAITINANNVTIDLNGWKVGGQAAGTNTQATGIYSAANNVTVKNGIVRGFETGIELDGRGAVIQDMLVDQSTYTGILTFGLGAMVEHNQVVDTGNTPYNDGDAYGIAIQGDNSTVINNMVSGLTASGSGYEFGIYANGDDSVRANTVSDTSQPTGGGTSYGLYMFYGIALNNTVSRFGYGIYIEYTGIYAFNTAYNCTTNFNGGTAGAGNSP